MITITYDPATHKLVPIEPTEAMVSVNTKMLHPKIAAEIYEAMLAVAPEIEPQQQGAESALDNRRCKKCASIRGGATCWKCGSETFTPDPRCGEEPRLPPIDRIRELAKEVGYAIGVHGSQQRDFDVIAAPWTDDAIGNHALLQHIADGLTTDNGPAHIISTERKPLGRYAATIQMDGWYKQLDISICPNEQYAPIATPAPAVDAALLWGTSAALTPKYKAAQASKNQRARALLGEVDAASVHDAALEEAALIAENTNLAAYCTESHFKQREDHRACIAAAIRAMKTSKGGE